MASTEATPQSPSSKSGFSIFTHRMKESLGLAEKTTTNEQVRDLSKKLDILTEHVKLTMKCVQKTTASMRGALKTDTAVSDLILHCF